MKKDGKYRYSLQFGSDSAEEIRAGELLERLGNKKSIMIVAALNDYMIAHPELKDSHSRIEIKMDKGCDRKMIEKIIRSVIEEKLNSIPIQSYKAGNSAQEVTEILEEDVEQMLDNLDFFQ